MDNEEINKNILDLQFQKHLIIASTSTIVAFTYTLGIVIAVTTGQLELSDLIKMLSLGVISIAVLGVCLAFLTNSIFHLKNIPDFLKDMKK